MNCTLMNCTRLNVRGGEVEYSAPVIDIVDVRIEKGFAQSSGGIIDYGPEGDAGFTGGDNNDMGEI